MRMPWSDAPAITVVLVAPVVVPLAQMLGNAAGAQHGLVAGFGLAVACNFLHSVLVHADPVHMPPGSADMALWPGSWARVAEALTLGLAATRLSAPGPGLAGLAAAGDGTRVPEDLPQVRRSAIMSVRKLLPWQCEYRVRMPDGGVRWHMTNTLPHREADGSVVSHGFTMDITDRKLAEQEIERLAFYDALTGLPNRRLLLDRLQRSIASCQRTRNLGALLFIDLDNFKDLNDTLGQYVLQTACEQLQRWSQHPDTAHLSISVNVSARQFRQPGFVAEVLQTLKNHNADPRQLKLELTESLLLGDIEDTIARMVQLKSEGVGFALDDFGTGYSSLSYLKRLPLDQVKIDQSFVRDVLTDPNDAAIVRTILALAKSLDLEVVAEGVETTGQLSFLRLHGCEGFQGYLFGRLGPVELFEREHFPGHSAPSLATTQPAQQEQRP